MRAGLKPSIVLHTAMFILLFAGLPIFNRDRSYEDQVVTVEILPVSELTNVKPQQKKSPKPVEKEVITRNAPKVSMPEPKSKPVVKVEPLPKPVIKKPDQKKEEPVKVKPVEKQKPEEKKPEKKKEEKSQATEDDFASVIKSVEEGRQEQEQKDKEEKVEENFDSAVDFLSNAKEQQYREGIPLSISEKDAIRQQIMKNWTVPSGAKDVQNTVVLLRLEVMPDGSISKVEIADKGRYASDSFFRAIADSAMRAVYKSNPLKNLPPDKYDVKDGWRDLDVNFDPSEMLY